ncbi:hypothetical protein C9374_011817 [Naegleria lovaniensis]|uniref:H-type lectin domain-containing protein n=1 Tax=Naegleria lovaniensis TaxID=51637 RepID=A0AA88KCZ5_NAELO|nr:uncharacterized protein C9374_011817 [Naegleria lovaniensis]KAG2373728.1 hypothetical protein C9374_011817 [Naegleria lovaniensis]
MLAVQCRFLLVLLLTTLCVLSHQCVIVQSKPLLENLRASLQNERNQDNLNIPGNEEFKFTAYNKQESSTSNQLVVQQLQITMVLNHTTLLFHTSNMYDKYKCEELNSNLMEFRYYKSCITTRTPKFMMELSANNQQGGVVLSLYDAFDASVSYRFELKKQTLSQEEKIDLIFNQMQNEIAMLKDILWYEDKNYNKMDLKKGVKVNIGNSYYTSSVSPSISHNNYPSQIFSGAIQISFPRLLNVTRVELEIKDGGSCNNYINPNSVTPFFKWGREVYAYTNYNSYYMYPYFQDFSNVQTTRSVSQTGDGIIKFSSSISSKVTLDILVIGVYSGRSDSTSCWFTIRNLKVF